MTVSLKRRWHRFPLKIAELQKQPETFDMQLLRAQFTNLLWYHELFNRPILLRLGPYNTVFRIVCCWHHTMCHDIAGKDNFLCSEYVMICKHRMSSYRLLHMYTVLETWQNCGRRMLLWLTYLEVQFLDYLLILTCAWQKQQINS